MNIVTHHDSVALAKEAAQLLAAHIQTHQSGGVLVLFSGGSALSVVDHLPKTIFGDRCTVSVVDERYTHDTTHHNFYNVIARLKAHTIAVPQTIDTTVQKEESFEEYVKRITAAHTQWHATHPQGKVVALFGIGEDGHTAGIFPAAHTTFIDAYERADAIVPVLEGKAHAPFCERITISLPYIRTISDAVVYVMGENKRAAVQRVYDNEGSLAVTPARVFRELRSATLCTSSTTDMI